MATTQDNVLFQKSLQSQESAEKPILKRELLYVVDNNASPVYSRNQIEWETLSLSNNGKLSDYDNGFLKIPTVCTYLRTGTGALGVMGAGNAHLTLEEASKAVKFKSPLAMFSSFTWSYNNDPVCPERQGVEMFSQWKMLSEWSRDDENTRSDTVGFKKVSPEWSYTTNAGLYQDFTELATKSDYYTETGKSLVLPHASAQSTGFDTCELDGDKAIFKKDVHIRLKDIPGFSDLPMVRGCTIKLTVRLNQGSCTNAFTDGASAAAGVVVNQQSSLKGSSCPVMITLPIPAHTSTYTETLHFGVGEIDGITTSQIKNCRMYIPSVVFSPEAEMAYLKQGVKKHIYEDYHYVNSKNVSGSYNINLTNGIKRCKALLIVPHLSASANKGIRQSESTQFAGPCAPYAMRDFNVEINGSDVYSKPLQYRYEHFEQELQKHGIDSGMSDGLSSGLISKSDHDGTYGYIFSDLSRRFDYDELVSTSVSIRGQITSLLPMDFHCFLIFEKDMSLDLTTGEKVV